MSLNIHMSVNNNTCIICLETLSKNQKKLKCNHLFDKNCIIEWFKVSNRCPLCKNIEFDTLNILYLINVKNELIIFLLSTIGIIINTLIINIYYRTNNYQYLLIMTFIRFISMIIRDIRIYNIFNYIECNKIILYMMIILTILNYYFINLLIYL